MYLIIIHVPIYVENGKTFVTTEWKRSLILLKDSFNGKVGQITVLAPSIPKSDYVYEQSLEEISESEDGIKMIPSIDMGGRAREFWLKQWHTWKVIVRQHVKQATVVHAGFDQLWKPIQFQGFIEGLRQNKITVFVADTDVVTQLKQLSKGKSFLTKIKNQITTFIIERIMRWSVSRADLSLLKGKQLQNRYNRYAKNSKDFHDTSFLTNDIISTEKLEQRLDRLNSGKELNLVYAGRFEERKGLKDAVEIIALCKEKGLVLQFGLIGNGPLRKELEYFAEKNNLQNQIHFLGSFPYGNELFNKLGCYDALLFTPLAEDTPRMIFDGFAAGLPLLGYDIEYSKDILESCHAGRLWRKHSIDQVVDGLVELEKNRSLLSKMSLDARKEAFVQAADVWYQKRAEWTLEILKKRNILMQKGF